MRSDDDHRPTEGAGVVEDQLRAAFARHETLTPAAGPLRDAIDRVTVRRRRRRRSVRMTGAALALVAVVSAPVLGQAVGAPLVPEAIAPLVPLAPARPAGPLDFLLLGLDGGDGRDNGHRADSVLMVHVPADRSRLYLISLPRDLGVEVPDRGFAKLNEAFYHGSHRPGERPDLVAGTELTERTVTALTGVRFEATATMTYAGLREVTDALGGVRVCLPETVHSVHSGHAFRAGCQQLDGAAALDLLRQRYRLSAGAHDRDRNGQRFAEALLHQVADPAVATNPVRLAAITRAAGPGLHLDLAGRSLADLFTTLRPVAARDAVGIGWSYRPEDGGRYESLDPAESRGLFDALRRDDVAGWVAAHPQRVTS
ncbi:LCP family protein [Plantactinospora sp. CA-290183]|uniref:LCP family protein n=1 Tax=Plantactinospora sp. CA-290183 TaxID=3240006 RepID=UPI003D92F4BF